MRIPTATYRLQFRSGMTFDKAITILPYLSRLGVSHLYASPIFKATTGSTHGYDTADPTLMDPVLGGMEGFLRLSDALGKFGLGLLLDIVPNHLAASVENPWWCDVLKHGRTSACSGYFDIDWSRRLTLPILTGELRAEIENGAARLVENQNGEVVFNYRGTHYPLDPATLADAEAAISAGAEAVVAILDRQHWRPIHWCEAASGLSYRRFFEITGLVGIRVEEQAVFDAVHATVIDLIRQGRIDGLRIDHIDGLADPELYLLRLREAVGPEIYIVVEKILGNDEEIPPTWPVQGTTGYEFISMMSRTFTSPRMSALDKAWTAVADDGQEPHAGLRTAKELMVDCNFEGEVRQLQDLFAELAGFERCGVDKTCLDAAVREVLLAFPVYRTYGSPRGLPETSARILKAIFRKLHDGLSESIHPALDFVRKVLFLQVAPENRKAAIDARTRLQHLTGPLLAKSLEDTFFYRFCRLIALNEVGGDPFASGFSGKDFHDAMLRRYEVGRHALSATTTHDTKRGEDARARLYALSEAPDPWIEAVARWRAMFRSEVRHLPDGPAPESAVEWLVIQALAGMLPLDLDPADTCKASERFLLYLDKAMREAKLRSNWNSPNLEYEQAVKHYASRMLESEHFLDEFLGVLAPYVVTGLYNSLCQTVLKCTCPGVPDVYNGCEVLDFSLVDPDNRQPIGFDVIAGIPLSSSLPKGTEALRDGRLKINLVASLLRQRKRYPDLFSDGSYEPLSISGPQGEHVLAFGRRHGDLTAVVIVGRLLFDALADWTIPASFWTGTQLELPPHYANRQYRMPFTGDSVEILSQPTPLGTLLEDFPFSLLVSDRTEDC